MDGYYLTCFIVIGVILSAGKAFGFWLVVRNVLPRSQKTKFAGGGRQINKAGRNPPPPKSFNKPPPTPDPPQTKRP